ncbi:hypothetical protein [Mesorhizobium sp. CAU 1741]|uniref:hypothetical protein n=1 Tax=Mesorhizobium sp. CAU 1741 TaxID=3140366 RepID=UPI00325BC8FD
MDAARAAAETGLRSILRPGGEIIFTRDTSEKSKPHTPTPEEVFEEWMDGRKVGGRAHR